MGLGQGANPLPKIWGETGKKGESACLKPSRNSKSQQKKHPRVFVSPLCCTWNRISGGSGCCSQLWGQLRMMRLQSCPGIPVDLQGVSTNTERLFRAVAPLSSAVLPWSARSALGRVRQCWCSLSDPGSPVIPVWKQLRLCVPRGELWWVQGRAGAAVGVVVRVWMGLEQPRDPSGLDVRDHLCRISPGCFWCSWEIQTLKMTPKPACPPPPNPKNDPRTCLPTSQQ